MSKYFPPDVRAHGWTFLIIKIFGIKINFARDLITERDIDVCNLSFYT